MMANSKRIQRFMDNMDFRDMVAEYSDKRQEDAIRRIIESIVSTFEREVKYEEE